MEEFDFEGDVKINRNQLEKECEKHSSLYFRYSDMEANAKAEKDAASDALDLIMSEKDEFYRANPREGMKITESTIKAWVTADPEVIAAKETLQKAKAACYRFGAMVSAMDHRKSQLNNLVSLFIHNYYSEPGNGGKVKDVVVEEKSQENRSRLGKRRRRGGEESDG